MKRFEYFLVGVFAALGAVIVEIVIDVLRDPLSLVRTKELTFVALFVLVEELAKFTVIRKKIDFANPLNTLLSHCFWIGLGFGLLELGIIFLNERAAYAGNTLSIIAVILVHIITTLLTGLTLSKLKFNGYYAVLAIIPALVVHLTFNYWILQRLN